MMEYIKRLLPNESKIFGLLDKLLSRVLTVDPAVKDDSASENGSSGPRTPRFYMWWKCIISQKSLLLMALLCLLVCLFVCL